MPELSSVSLLTAFFAGAISFLSPCVLPLVPGYVSFVAGQTLDQVREATHARDRLRTFVLGLFFVLGFSTVFTALGASATVLGGLLRSYRSQAELVGGAVVLLFGLYTTGVLRLSLLSRDIRYHETRIVGGRPLSAYLLGLAFAFGWTPCIGPVLGSILALTTASASNHGTLLLATYSLGLGLPFLIAALFTDQFVGHTKRLRRFGRLIQIGAGVVMIVMGVAMMTGRLTSFGSWLLQTFPGLARIG